MTELRTMTPIYLNYRLYKSPMARDELLKHLAEDFLPERVVLQSELSFWDKLASAQEYGLIEAHIDFLALENLRELVRRVTEKWEALKLV